MTEKVKALERLRDGLKEQYSRIYNPNKVEIGDFTYGLPIVRSWGEDARLKIGKFCSIGENVKIYLGGNHRTEWITTYPFNVLLKDQYPGIDGECAATKGDVIIGNDVWICDNVTILSGVTIGDGAVLANGAVVTKNVRPYAKMGGVPAEFIEYREAAHNLKNWRNITWWDWPLETLAEVIPFLCDTDVDRLVKFVRRTDGQADRMEAGR
jgi:acetyltransferase-like isoleucine patch superfamily enzyme